MSGRAFLVVFTCVASAAHAATFVVTTTNVHQLRKVAGPDQELHEIIGKPYDLEDIVGAVRKAMPD